MNTNQYYIGLMSGNSCDAIDAVLVNFESSGAYLQQTFSNPIPSNLKENINLICSNPTISTQILYDTEVTLSYLYVKTITNLLALAPQIKKKQIIAIGNHGQTIAHQPDANRPYSIQLGDPNIIAAKTGITTIMDFRRKDIAHAGQGAPLAPVFHAHLFPDLKKPTIFINIGGISNLSLLTKDQAPSGFDIGPGNLLLDVWCKKYQNKNYDINGQWARTGHLQPSILQHLLDDPFFRLPQPKSTGKDYFNLQWLKKKLQPFASTCSPTDIQTTLTHFSAQLILNAITHCASIPIKNIYLCGGGAYNCYLLELLAQQYPSIKTTDALGIPPHLVEATGFAWLAKQRIEHKEIDLRTITGSKKPTLLGGLYEP